jgi:anti-anti-sigma factor
MPFTSACVPPGKSMLIEIEQQDEICLLRCKGRFVSGPGLEYLEAKLEAIRRLNCRKVLADFSEVPSIGSMGLTFLLRIYDFAACASGGFVLTGVGPLVWQALQVTRLSGVIRVAASAALGLAALRGETL